ncbi:MAG: type II secretion system minor pseudopilin GspJ [Halioglobus sp.]
MWHKPASGFTLIEVLIALAITAFVSSIAYASLSTVLDGIKATREIADRTHEINRAWMIITRDLRQFSPRSIRDEFGEEESALTGGEAARFLLSFTRSGWHNPVGQQRSSLQRVNYLLEGEALWRESYTVLDRAGDTEPRRVKLLEGVEYLDLGFLGAVGGLEMSNDGKNLVTTNWVENWVPDSSVPGTVLVPPVALEIRMQLEDIGEVRRLYELPPM